MTFSVRVCGIIGSPRKSGNVDTLVSEVLRGAGSGGAETCKVYLNDLEIKPCQSCGVDPSPKYCLFDDDMREVYEALQSCDAIVLESPVYFDTVSAQTKLMIDRSNCLMPYVKRDGGTFGFERRMKKHKRGVFVAVAGSDQEFSTIQTTIRGFFNWTNTKLDHTILYSHDDDTVGGVKNDRRKMREAFEIGVQLATKA